MEFYIRSIWKERELYGEHFNFVTVYLTLRHLTKVNTH